MPAPTFTNLTGSGGSGATSFATASVSPTGNRLILATVHAYISTGAAQPAQPTVTGNGITYELVRAQDVDAAGTDRATMWVFRGMAASPSAGAITIDFGATSMTRCQWSVDQSDANVDTSGTNGSGAVVQTTGVTTASGATSGSVNYPVAMTAGNSGFSAWGHQVQEAKTPRASWTELADVTTVTLASVETQYIAGTDTAGSATWTTGSRAGGLIVEVKAGAAGTDLTVAGATQAQAADNVTLTQTHSLVAQGATQAQSAGNVTLTQVHNLSVDGATQSQTAANVTLTQVHNLTVQGATQAQSADNISLAGATDLTVANASQAQTAQSVALTQVHQLVVQGAVQAQSSSTITLTQVHNLTVASATQAQSASGVTLTQTHVLTVANAAQAQTAGNVTLGTEPLRDITVIANIRTNHVTGGVGLSDLIAGLRANHVTGGIDVPRNLRTGSVEYVTAEVTFVGETAAGIATATGQVQITTTDVTPAAADPNWVNPDVTTRTDSVPAGNYAVLSLSKLHTAGAAATYRLWAKVTDNPEIPILLCGSFDVRA